MLRSQQPLFMNINLYRKCAGLWVCTRSPILHAGNQPNISLVICIGNVNNMPSFLYQYRHRKVYRKFCPILHIRTCHGNSRLSYTRTGAGFMIIPVPVSAQERVQEILTYTAHHVMAWKFSTILHKDWYRIYDHSCTSIGTGKGTGNCALYCTRTCHGYSQL